MSCYYLSNVNEIVELKNDSPCEDILGKAAVSCCGNGDACFRDGFCQWGSSRDWKGGSGYYIAPCTDPSVRNPVCHNPCDHFPTSDVVWNGTSNQWTCCGGNSTDLSCDHPHGPSFSGPAPEQLVLYNESSSAATTLSPSAAATGAIGDQIGSGLSSDAKVGIGVGVGVGGLLLLALLGTVLWLSLIVRRMKKKMGTMKTTMAANAVEQQRDDRQPPLEKVLRNEIDGRIAVAEKPAHVVQRELDGTPSQSSPTHSFRYHSPPDRRHIELSGPE